MMTDKEEFNIKDHQLDSLKVSEIVRSKKDVQIWFISDGENGVLLWFKRLVLEYMMLKLN
jgi:CRISPR/Cas system CSM-associated protein Csm4 (group 5 of RAMP superfamily)